MFYAGDNEDTAKTDSNTQEDNAVDSKIRKGLAKIKKLDEILSEKLEREKEVKHERRLLEKEFRMQVESLIKEKGIEKVCGSQQLLSLCASTDKSGLHDDIEPIFTTQIGFEYYQENDNVPKDNSTEKEHDSQFSPNEKKQKKSKDFIKRNIQLAAQASETIPLTDEERTRLEELLADDFDLLLVENPFSVPSISTDGYNFSSEEKETLADINAKLKELIPVEEYNYAILDRNDPSVDGTDLVSEISVTPRSSKINFSDPSEVACGEKVLQEEHDERTTIHRLKDIEERLHEIYTSQDEEDESETIDPDLLRHLLDVNSRLTSSSVSICETVQSQSELLTDLDLFSVGSQSLNGIDTDRTMTEISVG